MLGGQDPRHYLPAGAAAMPVDSNGVPFDMSHVYASGNLAGDMYANVAANATGRALATRLYELTDDPGMKDMLSFLIARDTMHQQQWLAVLEELGGPHAPPIPNSFPQEQKRQEFSYASVPPASTEPRPRRAAGPRGPRLRAEVSSTSSPRARLARSQPSRAQRPSPTRRLSRSKVVPEHRRRAGTQTDPSRWAAG
jgi:Mn-containing catalase